MLSSWLFPGDAKNPLPRDESPAQLYCRLLPQSHAPSTTYLISAVGLSALEAFFKKNDDFPN
jgi:hypothetical protein